MIWLKPIGFVYFNSQAEFVAIDLKSLLLPPTEVGGQIKQPNRALAQKPIFNTTH